MNPPPSRSARVRHLGFYAVFATLTILSAAPFWRTHLLPMQDYPQTLLFARAWSDSHNPSSPFHGTYTTGFPLSPLVLPLLLLRALAKLRHLELAGRLLWTLYAVGLPLSALHLVRVLGRDRWSVLLVFPLVHSYWVIGGFFSFATAMPLLVLGLAFTIRWLEAPTLLRGLLLAVAACALHLWHALAFAQLVLDFGLLWLLLRHSSPRARLRSLLPLTPALAMFCAWVLAGLGRRAPDAHPLSWPPFRANSLSFFDYVAPIIPRAGVAMAVVALVVLGTSFFFKRSELPLSGFRVARPFTWLSAFAVVSYLALPETLLGVEGIQNRQAWLACLLFVFGWALPERRAIRAGILTLVGIASALGLWEMGTRFAAFRRESAAPSRLIDRLGPTDTVFFASYGNFAARSFPKAKPFVAIDLYASIRHGVLPNDSFAGYGVNFVRYVSGNPMPGLGPHWVNDPALRRFDYVLVRGSLDLAAAPSLRLSVREGGWALYSVCGSKSRPDCPFVLEPRDM